MSTTDLCQSNYRVGGWCDRCKGVSENAWGDALWGVGSEYICSVCFHAPTVAWRRLIALLFTVTEIGALAWQIEQAHLREQRRAARGLPCNPPAPRDYQDDE